MDRENLMSSEGGPRLHETRDMQEGTRLIVHVSYVVQYVSYNLPELYRFRNKAVRRG
jgi:hypothetical protein